MKTSVATVLLIGGAQASFGSAALRGHAGSSPSSFKKFDDKGCRTSSGSAGKEGVDYMLFKHVSKETCKFECVDLDTKCTGWEYAKGGKCEVWKEHIDKHELAYVHGVDCYIKKSGPNRHLVKTNSTSEDVEEWNY